MNWLPVEPVEVTWGPDGVEAITVCDREWWAERIALRATRYAEPKP